MNTISNTTHTRTVNRLNQEDSLLIAIGNSARSDDGLGWAFLERLEKMECFVGQTNSCYQLQVEDAEMIAGYPRIIFVDAWKNESEKSYEWEATRACNDFTFTTHALTPGAVLFLCEELYGKTPEAYTLKIGGIDWELKTGLSKVAKINLEQALAFFKEKIL